MRWGRKATDLCLRDSRVTWEMRALSYHLPFYPAFLTASKLCICAFPPPSRILSHLILSLTTGALQKVPPKAFKGSESLKTLYIYDPIKVAFGKPVRFFRFVAGLGRSI